VQPAEVTGGDRGPGSGEPGVEPAWVADLHGDGAVLDLLEHLDGVGHVAGDRLLAEHRDPGLDRGQQQGRVGVGGGGDQHAGHPGGQHGLGRVHRLGPESFGHLPGQRRGRVADDQRVHHRQRGEGGGVERTDPAEADQTKSHSLSS
jgi:hypothetical protein